MYTETAVMVYSAYGGRKSDETTCVGTFQYIGEGEYIEMEGEYRHILPMEISLRSKAMRSRSRKMKKRS